MKRVVQIKTAGQWDERSSIDMVVLDAQDRHRRRVVFVGERGATYLLDLPKPAQLRDGDALLLEDASLVRVTGKAEPLVEVSARSPRELARLAWHIGNRHTEVQIVGETLRMRRDHVLEEMLRGLGASLEMIEAPFDPESGAYEHGLSGGKGGHRHGA
jgi:urease accessory protein